MSVSPGRQTIAAVRATCVGAAILAGIPPLLPVLPTADAALATLVTAMLLIGYVPLVGLFPFNGWAVAAARNLGQLDIAAWALGAVPVATTVVFRISAGLPPLYALNGAHLITFVGLLSAVWSSVRALNATGRDRYFRILFADIGLCAAGLASASWAAIAGLEIVFATHIACLPFLAGDRKHGRGWWMALSAIPPAPGFWGRLLIVQACAVTNVTSVIAAVTVSSLITIATLIALHRGSADEAASSPRGWPGTVATLAAAAICLALALQPGPLVHGVLGIR
jgi:hypothetical protein